jgi:hypothetical protein
VDTVQQWSREKNTANGAWITSSKYNNFWGSVTISGSL